MPVVVVKDLHKHYGEVRAVDGLSFAVEAGEVLALLGPNGLARTGTGTGRQIGPMASRRLSTPLESAN